MENKIEKIKTVAKVLAAVAGVLYFGGLVWLWFAVSWQAAVAVLAITVGYALFSKVSEFMSQVKQLEAMQGMNALFGGTKGGNAANAEDFEDMIKKMMGGDA